MGAREVKGEDEECPAEEEDEGRRGRSQMRQEVEGVQCEDRGDQATTVG